MFSKEGLIVNVVLAAVAGFFMNLAVYQLAPDEVPEKEEAFVMWCGTVDEYYPTTELGRKGEQIFMANCTSCHAIRQKVVGPALKNVTTRWPDRESLVAFIRHPEKVIKSGKPEYARELYQVYKQAGFMPNNDYLMDEDMDALMAYLIEGASSHYNWGESYE